LSNNPFRRRLFRAGLPEIWLLMIRQVLLHKAQALFYV
jgi:hypothetical protein